MTTSKFNNKTVWITGASAGIGKAVAAILAKQGANLVLSGRREKLLNDIAIELKTDDNQILPLILDLENQSNFEELKNRVVAKFGSIDYLINNGGISQRSLSYETSLEVDRRLMEVNYFGTIALTKVVLNQMMKQKSGHLSVVTSVTGKFGFKLRSSYAASKHALEGFFESIRLELRAKNIKVLIISPGRINTEISKNALDKNGKPTGKHDITLKQGMDVNVCAQKMVNAMANNKKDIVIGFREKLLIFIRKWSLNLFDWIASKVKAT